MVWSASVAAIVGGAALPANASTEQPRVDAVIGNAVISDVGEIDGMPGNVHLTNLTIDGKHDGTQEVSGTFEHYTCIDGVTDPLSAVDGQCRYVSRTMLSGNGGEFTATSSGPMQFATLTGTLEATDKATNTTHVVPVNLRFDGVRNIITRKKRTFVYDNNENGGRYVDLVRSTRQATISGSLAGMTLLDATGDGAAGWFGELSTTCVD